MRSSPRSMRTGICPSTLRDCSKGYTRAALAQLFEGRRVSPSLTFEMPSNQRDVRSTAIQQLGRLSLSGVQEKYSLTQVDNRLRLTAKGERGTHILKPVIEASLAKDVGLMPANEHLTMQLAAQVFDVRTAANGLAFFPDGTPAYLTRRFDLHPDGGKWAVEDFATLAGRTPATHGERFKYGGNYLELFAVLRRFVPAYPIEAAKLFELLVFNYLVSNGDAHHKNFALIETAFGDYALAPAYDLLDTSLHVDDTPFALEGGLLPATLARGKVGERFRVLAREAGVPEGAVVRVFDSLPGRTAEVEAMVKRSFLPERARLRYVQGYRTRVNKLLR